MEVTLKDVQDYWTRYCARHELKPEIVAGGQRYIAMNHDYWADHSMQELQDKVVQELKAGRKE